jgi:hypothetical protein
MYTLSDLKAFTTSPKRTVSDSLVEALSRQHSNAKPWAFLFQLMVRPGRHPQAFLSNLDRLFLGNVFD